MKPQTHQCAICGEPHLADDRWYLLAESHWQDRLRILEWNDCLAAQAGIHCACSPLHVERLVVHWMTTGRIDHPFAFPPQEAVKRGPPQTRPASSEVAVDTGSGRLLGELAVDRESMLRILNESPQSLTAIMEALVSALRKEGPRKADSLEVEELELCAPHRSV